MTKKLFEKCPTCKNNAFEGLLTCETCNGVGFVESTILKDSLETLIEYAQAGINRGHKHVESTYKLIQNAKRHPLHKPLHEDIAHIEGLVTQLSHWGGESTMAMTFREKVQKQYESLFGKRYEPESEVE